MAGDIKVLDTGIYAKLNVSAVTTLATGGIHYAIAPLGTSLPYVIFQWQGGGERNLTPSRMRGPVYMVKGLAATQEEAQDIAEQIDIALREQTLTVTGWTNYDLQREDDINMVETEDDGTNIYHIGGMFRIRLSK